MIYKNLFKKKFRVVALNKDIIKFYVLRHKHSCTLEKSKKMSISLNLKKLFTLKRSG